MTATDFSYLLINVPLTDPTAPYHSLSYLVGATTAAGYPNYSCLDANLEALNFVAQPDQVSSLLHECAAILAGLEKQARLTRGDELTYRCAVKAVGLHADSVRQAIGVLQDQDQFYDYGTYRHAVLVIKRWLEVLSVRGFPGQFEAFSLRLRDFGNLSSIADLTNPVFLDRLVNPFADYFHGPFVDTLMRHRPRLVGLSVNYVSQLPFAVYLCRLIRSTLPDCVLCIGGTEVTDVVKLARHADDPWRLFGGCDAIVAGEGETSIVDILNAVAHDQPVPCGRPGLLPPSVGQSARLPAVNFENLATLPRPRYDIWDLTRYWSPEPVLLYSPSRGCYWNKCTFCDYGLNTDLPTSPSRNRPVETAIEELRDLARLARTVYFSVDAVSPAHLRRLARAIIDSGINIRWSAELRLERSRLREIAQELRDSGCVAISFGYESGSQRILDLINKGVRLTEVPDLLRELTRVGIGAQMMGFIGFPGETPPEALATFEFLRDHREGWTLAGIGDFVLTPGAIVAKRPEEFGIHEVRSVDGDDIVRLLAWLDAEGTVHGPGDMRSPAVNSITGQIMPTLDDRPFVGGIDAAHTILYFARYGARLVPPEIRDALPANPLIEAVQYATPLHGVDGFTQRADLEEFHRGHLAHGRGASADEVQQWLAEYPVERAMAHTYPDEVLEIYPSGRFITLTAERAEFERTASAAYHFAKALVLRAGGER
ncbi:MAG TPA: radical SAM protein [Chloroflexota bacterium]|jgi:hypothetical protein|nr:radical SAM protein [Chloroflexota bacterium]